MQRTPDGPALSLLVPTYGRPDKAHALLERLARQTAPPGTFEVVLVDDGSDPPLEAPARELPFALTLLRQENAGPAAARNRGLEAVRADLVLILNDDCVPSDDLVEKHLAAHAELTGDVAVLGTFGFTERSKESAFTRLLEDSTLLFAYPALEHGGRYGWDVFWTCNISLSAQAIRDVGGFDAARFDRAICEDVELGARLASRGLSVVYREDCIAHHEHRMDPVEYMDRAFTLGIYQCRLASKFGHPELFFPNGAVGADGAPADWLRSAIQDCESSALEALDALVEVEEVFEARPMPEDTVRDAREVVLRHSQFFRLAGLHLELTGEDLRPNALLDAARARRDARHAARSIRSAGAPSVRAPGSAMVPSAAAPSEAGPSEVDPAGASASTPASASPVRSAVRLSERGPDAPELSIVVVSCDALDNTRRCVESLRAAADPRFPQEILAVDNGSTDGSAEWLAEQADVTLVRNAANHGAPRARNQGIARARGAWIAFFDNDVVVPRAWIPRALEHARNADDVGAIPLCANRASKHQVVAYDGTDDIASIERFANTHYGQHAGEGVDATLFTSLAVVVRREVVERIGGFDETFSPWGFEDDDYALRVRLAGWRNRVARDSFVYHAHYQTQEKHERHAGWLQANWDAFLAKWCPGRAGARLFDYEGVTVPSVETVTDAQLVFALPADGAEPPHWDGAEHGAARTVEAENEPGESTSHGATDAFRAITEEIRSVADANATLRPVPKPGGAARRPAQPRAAETQSGATFPVGSPLPAPELSVILPVDERGADASALERCLTAFDQQTARGRFELVVVDASGIEDTARRLTERAQVTPTRIVRTAGGSAASAYNAGLRAARGTLALLARVDVVAAPELVERHLAAHAKRGAGLAITGTLEPSLEAREFALARAVEGTDPLPGVEAPSDGSTRDFTGFCTGNVSLALDDLRAVGLFDETFPHPGAEALELGHRLESERGLRVVHDARARATSSTFLDVDALARNTRGLARSFVHLLARHPELVAHPAWKERARNEADVHEERIARSSADRAVAEATARALSRIEIGPLERSGGSSLEIAKETLATLRVHVEILGDLWWAEGELDGMRDLGIASLAEVFRAARRAEAARRLDATVA